MLNYVTNANGTKSFLKVTLPITQSEANTLKGWIIQMEANSTGPNAPFHDMYSSSLLHVVAEAVRTYSPTQEVDGSYYKWDFSPLISSPNISGYVLDASPMPNLIPGSSGELHYPAIWFKPYDITSRYTVDTTSVPGTTIYRNPETPQPVKSIPVPGNKYYDSTNSNIEKYYPDPLVGDLVDFYGRVFYTLDNAAKEVVYQYAESLKDRAYYVNQETSWNASGGILNIEMAYKNWKDFPYDVDHPQVNVPDPTSNEELDKRVTALEKAIAALTAPDLKSITDRLDALEKVGPGTVDLSALEHRIQVQEHDTSVHDTQIKGLESVVHIHEEDIVTIKNKLDI